MRRARDIAPAGTWRQETATATVTLAFDDRHRRRLKLTDDSGEDFLLDLAETARIRDGDGLRLEDDVHIRVRAAEEDVLDIFCRDGEATAKVAWYLGNRHTPVQILSGEGLRIRYDHVLAEMVNLLGAEVTRSNAPFDPEAGAYAESHGHDHEDYEDRSHAP
ncbi:MAG: Urease accessory protein UreE [Rhodospirillaceae bacterium TMED167]|nr:Urease accessory protein UreE [Rhodospirillaceae bacterium]MDG2034881.1 urease accessory protein UreE [Rhodospirillales bacterium]OUW29404.1 MAG: Urease accessory protein UreE [Rhodospirillaceae bacterium TMED167]